MQLFIQTIVLMGSLAAMLWGMMKFLLKDIHKDLVDLKEGQKRLENRMDRADIRMDKTESRIDHLYQETNRLYAICIDMLGDRSTSVKSHKKDKS